MTKKKAIELLKEIIDEGCLISDFEKCPAIEACEMAIEALEQEPRWIPISERLPMVYESVNCTCHSLIDGREDWVVETCYLPQPPNSPYSDWGNIPMLNHCECEVIAWMHRDIPKPYKGESEET